MTESDRPDRPADPRCEAALARLASTRQALHERLHPRPAPSADRKRDHDPARRMRAWWRWAQARLRLQPITDLAASGVSAWWRQHPLHPVGERLRQEFDSGIVPLVRRHPRTSVALVAGTAALVVALRPWRWPWIRDEVHQAPVRLQRWGLRWARQVPWEAVWATAALLWSAPQAPRQGPEHPDTGPRSTDPG